MNTLNTSSYTDEQDDDLDLNMLTLQQAPLKAKYPHVHCHCMQPLIFVIRRTYITTLRRIARIVTAKRTSKKKRPYVDH
jgi:hypothetical protein